MALKSYNPRTPSQRQLVRVDRSELHKGKPVKNLTEGLTKSGGRNNTGRITSWHRGGGHKRRYRMIDFKRRQAGFATVERLEYDPNRTAFIALIKYDDSGELSYILAPQRLAVRPRAVQRQLALLRLPSAFAPHLQSQLDLLVHCLVLLRNRPNLTSWYS